MQEQRLLGKYELLDEVGRGGFATVYRARDIRMRREVALKVIRTDATNEAAFIERFEQEVHSAASLQHPHIMPVYEFGDESGVLYLTMPLIRGRTLRAALDERQRLSLDQALPILSQLAEALDYLAAQKLVHRDIKPANVLLEHEADNVWVTLTDFGLIRSLENSMALTRTTNILGTPAYMAPEQIDSKKWGEVSPLTDVYALGIIAYEMLVGQPPFAGEITTVMHAQVYKLPSSPLQHVPDLGPDVETELYQVLAKSPEERHSTAGEFVEGLRQAWERKGRREAQEVELAQLIAQALEAEQAGDWHAVHDLCGQVLKLDRAHASALAMFDKAHQEILQEGNAESMRRRRLKRYEEGQSFLAAGQWRFAMDAFEEISKGDPNFLDVQRMLDQSREELQIASWYDAAIVLGESKRWDEACRVLVKLLRSKYDYRSGDAMQRLIDATEGLLIQTDELRAEHALQSKALERLAVKIERQKTRLSDTQRALKRILTLGRDRLIWEKDGKEMVRIPGGEFWFGKGRYKHRVSIEEFWIDKTPVTNAEYGRFLAENPLHPIPSNEESLDAQIFNWDLRSRTWPKGKKNHPVVLVNWNDALAYAQWAGKLLPSDRQWEKAARGNEERNFAWGSAKPTTTLCQFKSKDTAPVGKHSPKGDSPYGCVDMTGNVWEWTQTRYSNSRKVVKGGAWTSARENELHVTQIYGAQIDVRDEDVGFRCVVVIEK